MTFSILTQVKMPITRMDLGGMESMQATVNMDPWLDKAIAIAAPLLLVLITLPATIVRAALLGLDCVVLRYVSQLRLYILPAPRT